MIERIHQHLLSELERSTRADTIFVICTVLFNILALFISWSNVPARGGYSSGSAGIYTLANLGIIVVGATAFMALRAGQRTCREINTALMQIYKDANVDRYLPASAAALGLTRFRLYFVVVAATGVLALAIPALQLFKL